MGITPLVPGNPKRLLTAFSSPPNLPARLERGCVALAGWDPPPPQLLAPPERAPPGQTQAAERKAAGPPPQAPSPGQGSPLPPEVPRPALPAWATVARPVGPSRRSGAGGLGRARRGWATTARPGGGGERGMAPDGTGDGGHATPRAVQDKMSSLKASQNTKRISKLKYPKK
ncbi:translation initiation factor IF-2-like [Sphaerodactylus townsendi]|uniref:translation initiation factor IF-2-like n=1 Tax=Sphaerodactylus townsendi TaxID=933632 RepID=UPI00202634A5|nr:translation initiation factor IF-2-like [Sphaerodactylus townsendi]